MRIIVIICFIFLLFQCKDTNEVTEEMVHKKLQELRQNFIKDRTEECNKLIMKEVEEKADSILIYMSKKIKYDSLTIPHDSIRPEKPEVKFPEYRKPEKPVEKRELDSSINPKIQTKEVIKSK